MAAIAFAGEPKVKGQDPAILLLVPFPDSRRKQ